MCVCDRIRYYIHLSLWYLFVCVTIFLKGTKYNVSYSCSGAILISCQFVKLKVSVLVVLFLEDSRIIDWFNVCALTFGQVIPYAFGLLRVYRRCKVFVSIRLFVWTFTRCRVVAVTPVSCESLSCTSDRYYGIIIISFILEIIYYNLISLHNYYYFFVLRPFNVHNLLFWMLILVDYEWYISIKLLVNFYFLYVL